MVFAEVSFSLLEILHFQFCCSRITGNEGFKVVFLFYYCYSYTENYSKFVDELNYDPMYFDLNLLV